MRGELNGRTRRAASRKMWEKANVGVRMTASSIPGALWLLRWQTHTLRILLGLFAYANRRIPHLQRDNSFPRERFVPLFHLTD